MIPKIGPSRVKSLRTGALRTMQAAAPEDDYEEEMDAYNDFEDDGPPWDEDDPEPGEEDEA